MKNFKSIIISTIAVILFFSCTKWDDFKKYVQDGEVIYTGKMDSVKIFSGKERVMLYGLLKADPKVNKFVVYWNNNADSIAFDWVKSSSGVDTVRKIFAVDEGVKSFKIVTYDAAGNKSVVVNTTGTSYGETFRKRLSDRLITSVAYTSAGTTINWDEMDRTAGPQYTEIEYTVGGNVTTFTTPISNPSTILQGVNVVPPIKYRTIFRPDSTCIDTFSTPFTLHNVIADVTALYLSNTGPGFQRVNPNSGRWGVLAAPWITNAAAKNKDGGVNGGYTADSRWGYSGFINWETWGNNPVTDGKLYQPTSTPLPAGTYTVSFRYYSEIQSNSTVYCIVAAGGSGIPSLPDLSTALGYTLLYNGVPVGSTSPSRDETKSFTFTLASPQTVSIGFLGNIVGSGNPGSYFVVQNITLIKN